MDVLVVDLNIAQKFHIDILFIPRRWRFVWFRLYSANHENNLFEDGNSERDSYVSLNCEPKFIFYNKAKLFKKGSVVTYLNAR